MNALGVAFGIALLGGVIATGFVLVGPEAEPAWDTPVLAQPPIGQPTEPVSRDDLRSVLTRLVVDDVPLVALVLPADALNPSTLARSATDPLDSSQRVVVYDARSTHLGCLVGWYEGPEQAWLMDPCHQSQFDPYADGANRPGQPAPRPLPAYESRWTESDGSWLLHVRAT